MDDLEFLKAFHQGTLSSDEFRHRGHLRLAWLVLRQQGLDEAIRNISAGIRQYAILKGSSGMYNETLTQFWIRIVSHALQTDASSQEFERFLKAFPILMDQQLPFRHWRPETLNGSPARSGWLEPDLLQLPF